MKTLIALGTLFFFSSFAFSQECRLANSSAYFEESTSDEPKRWIKVTNRCPSERYVVVEAMDKNNGWVAVKSDHLAPNESIESYVYTVLTAYRYVVLSPEESTYLKDDDPRWQVRND